jgi:DNA-binding NtrC family response regulator
MARVILVDDEPDLLESCVRILEEENISCASTTDPLKAMDLVRAHTPGALVTDFKMPGMNGVELLDAALREFPDLPVIMISAYATIEGVVEAVKMGAFDYITKPFSPDQLVITVRRALERTRLKRENELLQEKVREDYLESSFGGRSPAMAQIAQIVKKVAPTRTCALIAGETGSGKERVARAIHICGGRGAGPFIVADCAGIARDQRPPADLAGHAWEGATIKRLFDAARGGTLYLKRLEDLHRTAQSELSRALQGKAAGRAGRRGSAPEEARVISSTGAGLKGMALEGKFRQDLYYLLNVVNIQIPPLRERLEDIPWLCERILKNIAARDGGAPKTAGGEFATRLAEYHWPGNVRELLGVLETALAAAGGGQLTVAHLPDHIRRQGAMRGMTFKEARDTCLRKFERDFLENLLYTSKGNITQASETAGISRMSLYRMLNRNHLGGLAEQEREMEKGKSPGGSGPDIDNGKEEDDGIAPV